jgi:ATP-dependent Lon protease
MLSISENTIKKIVREYTRESGVRNLERELAAVCRKAAKQIVTRKTKKVRVTVQNLTQFLGAPRYRYGVAEEEDQVGAATGLAWTEVGGDTLNIEVTLYKGNGRLILTGKLGEVMKESAQAGYSYVRSRAALLGINEDFFEKNDVHVHIPEGAIPKDGPSAGITIACALASAMTGRKVRHEVAMTGEVTLRGRVLPVGGIKEKVLAAHRAGIRKVILPKENEKDLEEIPKKIRTQLEFTFVEHMDEVLEEALLEGDDGQVSGELRSPLPALLHEMPYGSELEVPGERGSQQPS